MSGSFFRMSGQIDPADPLSCNPESLRPSGGAAPISKRLLVALLVSCLLHINIIAIPYLGERSRDNPPASQITHNFPDALSLSVSLKLKPHADTLSLAEPPLPEAVGTPEPLTAESMPIAAPESPSPSSHSPPTEGAGLLPLPAPIFFTTDQLSKRPQPLDVTDLDTPETRPIVASGKMILKLWINELGEVIDVEVEKTELPDVFSKSAIATFKRLPFIAGERGGIRVGSVMRIEVSYVDGRLSAP